MYDPCGIRNEGGLQGSSLMILLGSESRNSTALLKLAMLVTPPLAINSLFL